MIKLSNITKYYNDGKNVSLGLRKINLEFNRGEFIAVTGESGSGKSTLLNVLSGIDTYEEGELYFNNKPTSHYDSNDWEEYRNKKIGFIFQNYNLIDSYTVLDNVMSTLYIQGYDKYIAQQRAISILKKVNLLDKSSSKAVQLSSGQKQRLSIARALAKDTEVIMADEPTGNLDVENGKEIIKLLYEISKEKLVIIVTHNYDEVKDYTTRKVVMCDGEVQLDTLINNIDNDKNNYKTKCLNENTKDNSQNKQEIKSIKKSPIKVDNDLKIAKKIAFLNMKSQPKKAVLLCIFFIVTSLTSFIFLGGILSSLDDTSTKVYNNNIFLNNDTRRITVKKTNDENFNNEEIKEIANIKNVIMVDKYDLANEISYYYRKNKDYELSFDNEDNDNFMENKKKYGYYVLFKDYKNFVTSCNFYKKEDLRCGRLPEKLNEVLISSNDKSLLGQEIDFYFNAELFWPKGNYVHKVMKVVGLVNSNTERVYFTEDFERMLTGTFYTTYVNFDYFKKGFHKYNERAGCNLVINNNLKNNEVIFSQKLKRYIKFEQITHPILRHFSNYNYNEKEKIKEPYYEIDIKKEFNNSSSTITEVNENLFYSFYKVNENQIIVFAKDYIYVDEIMSKLTGMGYESVSPIKLCSILYDKNKVRERLINLSIYILAVIITSILEIIIIRALLKYKKRDFVILKIIGMKSRIVSNINYIEITFYKICSIIFSMFLIYMLNFFRVCYIAEIFKYYTIGSFTVYIVINIVTLYVLILSYNKFLCKHFNITSLSNN